MNKITMSLTTKKIAYIAVLAAVNVALNAFGVPLPGYATKLSFTYIPCFIAGIFMGPFAGLLVGLIGDVLGMLINPQGAWIPLITLGSALMGFIPGVICRYLKLNIYIKIGISLVAVLLICSMGINTYGLFTVLGRGRTFWVYLAARMPMQSIIFAVNSVLIYVLYPVLKKTVFRNLPNSRRIRW